MLFTVLAVLASLSAALARPATHFTNTTDCRFKDISRAYLVNCYTDPTDGTRGEVDFYRKAPLSTFGHALPEISSIMSNGINEVWENSGGTTSAPLSNATFFTWTINYTYESVQKVAPGFEVGTATMTTGQKFALFKGDLEELYSLADGPVYTCYVVYTAVQTNQS